MWICQVRPVTEDIGRIIMTGGRCIDVADQAAKDGIWDLRRAGLNKVRSGLTSLDEINSVTMDSWLAEDTSTVTAPVWPGTFDDPAPQTTPPTIPSTAGTDDGTEIREQIGRFCPLSAAPASESRLC